MYPTNQPGDRLLALRFWPCRWLRRGQIVIWKLLPTTDRAYKQNFTIPGPFIKRIVGLPGDEVIVPVVKLSEPVDKAKLDGQEILEELRKWYIPAGHCFVKGDSPDFDITWH